MYSLYIQLLLLLLVNKIQLLLERRKKERKKRHTNTHITAVKCLKDGNSNTSSFYK